MQATSGLALHGCKVKAAFAALIRHCGSGLVLEGLLAFRAWAGPSGLGAGCGGSSLRFARSDFVHFSLGLQGCL